MEMKRMHIQVVNLTTGKVFSLPTLYTDRVEACVCGQNYIRDRKAENMSEMLFFRVLDARPDGTVAPSYELWNNEDEDDEEPEHGESVYGDAEEPSTESLAEILSVFNAMVLNP